MNEITQDLVKSLFNYKDGELYWKIANSNRIKISDKAGTLHKQGYYKCGINNKKYYNHRIIFLYHNGYIPEF